MVYPNIEYYCITQENCSKSAAGLLPCCHQADIRMRSHRLLRFDDKKSAANCQQACCMLIIKNFDPYAVSTTYSKSANIKQGRIKSVNWGGGVHIHIFRFYPTNSFEINLISKELVGQNLNI